MKTIWQFSSVELSQLTYFFFSTEGQVASISHRVDGQIDDLAQRWCFSVEQNGAVQNQTPQFEERVQRQRCNVRLGPTTSAFFYILLEFHPAGSSETIHTTYLLLIQIESADNLRENILNIWILVPIIWIGHDSSIWFDWFWSVRSIASIQFLDKSKRNLNETGRLVMKWFLHRE